ncbi:hypothetical protein EVAR_50961_1 [Eumeta japonica]|uniref:Uncharacterized protein n=1 Tax=Eumeta variegata TaxID=151549 RepID=A0A4C1XEB8_EUMVA|nr:hypothetical protein EVAR_50961_1 [Eumeta japonica]
MPLKSIRPDFDVTQGFSVLTAEATLQRPFPFRSRVMDLKPPTLDQCASGITNHCWFYAMTASGNVNLTCAISLQYPPHRRQWALFAVRKRQKRLRAENKRKFVFNKRPRKQTRNGLRIANCPSKFEYQRERVHYAKVVCHAAFTKLAFTKCGQSCASARA